MKFREYGRLSKNFRIFHLAQRNVIYKTEAGKNKPELLDKFVCKLYKKLFLRKKSSRPRAAFDLAKVEK